MKKRQKNNKKLKRNVKILKKKLKQEIKTIKLEIKNERKHRKDSIKKTKNEIQDKKQRALRIDEIKENSSEKVIELKNKIVQLKYDYGKKYNTTQWQLFKWMYGVRKEFNRIIWSPPSNTFKYLLIIVIIVLFLSGIFMGINEIVNRFLS